MILLLQKSGFLACLLLSASLFAADAPKITFRGLTLVGDVGGIYFTNAKGEAQEFRASDYVRSEFYKTLGGVTLTFYKILPAEKEGEEPIREVVGSIQWPAGNGPFLVFASENGGKYDFSVAPDDEDSFPMGSFRVFNASRDTVNVSAAEKAEIIQPGESVLLRPAPPVEGKGILFQVGGASSKSSLYYTNVWSGSQTTRTLVFIVNRANPHYPIGVKRLHESDLVLKYQREKEAQEEKEAKTR